MKKDELLKNIDKALPGICTGFSIIGFLTASVLAVRATPEAMQRIENKKQELNVEKLSMVDTVKTAGPVYILPASIAVASTGTSILGCTKGYKSVAAVVAGYEAKNALQSKVKDNSLLYKTIVKNETSDDEHKKIKENYISKVITEPYAGNIERSKYGGNELFYDPFTDRYFISTVNTVTKAANTIDSIINREGSAGLNDLYDEIGVSPAQVYEYHAWHSMFEESVGLALDSKIAWEETNPTLCWVMYYNEPNVVNVNE